jgi:DNA-binding MarR family transcriptional regulator
LATPAVNGSLPWALGEPLEFLRLLWGVAHALHSTSKRLEATLGVTGPQRLALQMVGRFPQITAGQLARLLHVDPSTLTGIVQRLVRRGLLLRRPDPQDGRRTLLGLTAEGRRFEQATGRPAPARSTRAARSGRAGRSGKTLGRSPTETTEAAVARALSGLRRQDVAAARKTLTALTEALGDGGRGSSSRQAGKSGKATAGTGAEPAARRLSGPRRVPSPGPVRRLVPRPRPSAPLLAHS